MPDKIKKNIKTMHTVVTIGTVIIMKEVKDVESNLMSLVLLV